MDAVSYSPSREQLVHSLYEAAELEHNLMCTYLYAAFSLKDGADGLSPAQADAAARWRRAILDVAVEEMGHLAAVWNITSALGGAPGFGRDNFPLDPGYLPAGVVVRLAPFSEHVLQHFIHLERPHGSLEPDGAGFEPARRFTRGMAGRRLTPMAIDYDTVGEFYERLSRGLESLVARVGEAAAFCGDPALQLSPAEVVLGGARPVLCSKTALAAFDAIVKQGEGAPADQTNSHFRKFIAIRAEFEALKAADPAFHPAHPAAVNPVLRRPPNPDGRVWLEDVDAVAIVDVANSAYQLMLRLLAYAYMLPSPGAEKALSVDLSVTLMRAVTLLGESAARRPAGPSNPGCNAGVSFTALRDSGAFAPGAAARRFFIERLRELAEGAAMLDQSDARVARAARQIAALAERAAARFEAAAVSSAPAAHAPETPRPAPPTQMLEGVEIIEGEKLTLFYEGRRCIHSRYCVTGAPNVFLANVQGPWIHPDAMDAEDLAAIARECPSGAIKYKRKDGHEDEPPPPVNLARVLEAGPYAVRGDIVLDGARIGYRATLCRCGASKHKPYCDGSHHEAHFNASGEPETGEQTAMLAARDGPLAIDPQIDGPLMVRGNLEIIAGTGRMTARLTSCRLCRCGQSGTKPYCDGTHARAGFRS